MTIKRAAPVQTQEYGTLLDGRRVQAWTLTHGGLSLTAITLGGIVTRLWVPDRAGRLANVVLGFDALQDYVDRSPHFGTIVGRYANRIAGASLPLDGQIHTLSRNDGPNCLHGGARGFGTRLWEAVHAGPTDDGGLALQMHYTSADGEEGFPGELRVQVRYTLGADQSWRIDYEAQTDGPTVVNLTHHAYFNLAGGGTALAHRLTIHGSRYTQVDADLVPVGLADVAQTPFDFRQPTLIDLRVRDPDPQLLRARGYDHCWWLDDSLADAQALRRAARLEDPASGRWMEVSTREPTLQFYSGNFLDGTLAGAGGRLIRQGDGVCLETQHAPDSPHQPGWPSTVLRPGHSYHSATVHRFGADG